MYDINVKNVKKGKNIFFIFLAAGILFLVIMLWIYISSINKLKSLDSSVMSTGVDIKTYINDEGNTMYTPVYTYEVKGRSYTCGSDSSSNIYPGKENKKVYFDSKNPENCMTEYSKSGNNMLLLFMIVPIIFIVFSIFGIIKVNKRVKAVLELNQNGKLVKNLQYRMENTGTIVNGVPIQRPVVDYVLPNGISVTLYGDARNDKKSFDSDGMVDIIIDENNPENYYIDFEINRLSGNLPQDYYQQSPNSNSENNNIQNMPNQPAYNQNINNNQMVNPASVGPNNYNQPNNNYVQNNNVQNIQNQGNNY